MNAKPIKEILSDYLQKKSLNEINIINSYRDALDIDFSKVDIDYINIVSAGNDCVDLSFGIYKINEANIRDCGDKAVSVGEQSELTIKNLNVLNSITGIASKDSSKTKLENGYFKDLNICLAAYNKKQEFLGGLIKINNFVCLNTPKKIFVDDVSTINFNN